MSDTPDPTGSIDWRDPDAVCRAFREGTEANHHALCRRGSIDLIGPPGHLIASGDIHDNPVHLDRLLAAAGLRQDSSAKASRLGAHLTLHEVIHSERLINGMDLSYRALGRVAAVKAAFPERVHTLLANHELAQIVGAGVIKNGVRMVEAFNAGVEYMFGAETDRVTDAIAGFVRSMPLALRCHTTKGDILCSHSLPGPAMMGRFDPGVLDRALTEDDIQPRTGSAYMMVWGRGYDAEQLEDLVERWGVSMFILGHEHAPTGAHVVEPNAVVLNSDHEHGVYLPIDLATPPSPNEAVASVRRLDEPQTVT